MMFSLMPSVILIGLDVLTVGDLSLLILSTLVILLYNDDQRNNKSFLYAQINNKSFL